MDQNVFIFLVILAAAITFGVWDHNRKARRRATLRKDESSGGYVWIDFDGSERRSDVHPDKPGGDWYSDGGDGGGDGGGGD